MQQCSPSLAQNKKQEVQNKHVMHSYVDIYNYHHDHTYKT
jgi:hypothetical protein